MPEGWAFYYSCGEFTHFCENKECQRILDEICEKV
jgi:hypothetical protein